MFGQVLINLGMPGNGLFLARSGVQVKIMPTAAPL